MKRGIPAAAVLAGGINRAMFERQAIPVIHAAGVLQPPVKLEHVGGGWSPSQHTRAK